MTDLTPEERKIRALEAIAGALMVIADHYDQGEVEEPESNGIKTLGDGAVSLRRKKDTDKPEPPPSHMMREGSDEREPIGARRGDDA